MVSMCVFHTTPGSMSTGDETAPCSSSSFKMHASPGRGVKVQTLAQWVQAVLCMLFINSQGMPAPMLLDLDHTWNSKVENSPPSQAVLLSLF